MELFTSKDEKHNHRIEMDGQGTGTTIDTSYGVPHTHKIKDYVVEEKDGHTHTVSQPKKEDILGENKDNNQPVVSDMEHESTEENIEKHKLQIEIKVKSD